MARRLCALTVRLHLLPALHMVVRNLQARRCGVCWCQEAVWIDLAVSNQHANGAERKKHLPEWVQKVLKLVVAEGAVQAAGADALLQGGWRGGEVKNFDRQRLNYGRLENSKFAAGWQPGFL